MATHHIELTFDARTDETFGPPIPAGRLKVDIATNDREIEISGHRIDSGSLQGQAVALKSLVFAARQLANDLGYSFRTDYIDRIIENDVPAGRAAYAAASEIH